MITGPEREYLVDAMFKFPKKHPLPDMNVKTLTG